MDFGALVAITMGAVLVNNYVLRQFLGVCPFLGVSKELKNSVGMGAAVIFVMLLATAATWPIQIHLLNPNGLGFLQTIVFILIIAALVQLVEITLKRFLPPLYDALGVFLPLMTTNCAIMGVAIININRGFTFLESMVNSFGAGLGFLLAMVLFSGIRANTESSDPPASFKGMPLTLISAAILSFAFFGFSGVVENLFG